MIEIKMDSHRLTDIHFKPYSNDEKYNALVIRMLQGYSEFEKSVELTIYNVDPVLGRTLDLALKEHKLATEPKTTNDNKETLLHPDTPVL